MKQLFQNGEFVVLEDIKESENYLWLARKRDGDKKPQLIRFLCGDDMEEKWPERRKRIIQSFSQAANDLARLQERNEAKLESYMENLMKDIDRKDPEFVIYESHKGFSIGRVEMENQSFCIGLFVLHEQKFRSLWLSSPQSMFEESDVDGLIEEAKKTLKALLVLKAKNHGKFRETVLELLAKSEIQVNELDLDLGVDMVGHHPNRLDSNHWATKLVNEMSRRIAN